MQISIQTFGTLFAVAFAAPAAQDIIDQYNSICNLGYTSGDLYWLNNRNGNFFAYLWLEEKDFRDWMWVSSLRIFENKIDENVDDLPLEEQEKAYLEVKKILGRRSLALEYDTFIPRGGNVDCNFYNYYSISGIEKTKASA